MTLNIIQHAAPERDFRVYTIHGTAVLVKAPDADVALYRAQRRGIETSGTVREARS
jgi:hypothetical protein